MADVAAMLPAGTWQTLDTVYSADSVEWCPVAGYQDLLLCGTYQLEENDSTREEKEQKSQVRVGRLYLHKVNTDLDHWSLEEQARIDMPGILDIKWSRHAVDAQPTFALVNSVGQLKVMQCLEDRKTVSMTTEIQINVDCLGLSLEWNNTIQTCEQPQIAVSDSTGGLSVYQLTSADLKCLTSWKGHDFEAWITAFNQWDPNTLYSGGDDCRLKAWDLRMEPISPVMASKRYLNSFRAKGEIMIQCANSLDPEAMPIIGVTSGSKLFDTLILSV